MYIYIYIYIYIYTHIYIYVYIYIYMLHCLCCFDDPPPKISIPSWSSKKTLTVKYEGPQLSLLIITSDLETSKIEPRSPRVSFDF